MMIQLTPSTLLGKISRLICTATSVLGLGLGVVAIPSTANAAGADGKYRVISAKGSYIENGETPILAESVMNQIVKDQSAAMMVKGLKLNINRNMTESFFRSGGKEVDIKVKSKVTGPSSITLVPTGNYFTGKNLQPITTKLSYIKKGEKRSFTVKTNVVATIKGNILTVTTRFNRTSDDDVLDGVITLVGKR